MFNEAMTPLEWWITRYMAILNELKMPKVNFCTFYVTHTIKK